MKNKTLILILSAILLIGGCSSKNIEESSKPAQSENTDTEKEQVAGVLTEEESDDKKEENKKEEADKKEETKKEEEKSEEKKEEEKKPEAVKPAEDKKPSSTQKPSENKPAPTPTPAPTPAPAPQKKSFEEVMNNILSGVNTPNYELTPIDASNFSYYMFIDFIEGAKGVSADALISSTAHSVCLVELPEGMNAESVAAKVKQNADPAKWICVEAEAVEAVAKDNMVLLVMSDSQTTNAIVNNFKQN